MNSLNLLIYVIFSTILKDSIDAFVGIGNYSGNDINLPECGLRYKSGYIYIKYDLKCFLNTYETKLVINIEGLHSDPQKGYPHNRILEGKIAAYAEAPWVAYIIRSSVTSKSNSEFSCNGVLITFEWILTTAKCLNDSSFSVAIHTGSQLKEGLEIRKYGTVFIHPLYNGIDSTPAVRRANDIALFKTHKKFVPKVDGKHLKINPICLPTRTRFNVNYEWTTLFAFRAHVFKNEKRLKTAETLLTPYSKCPKQWPYLLCSQYNYTYYRDRPSASDFGAGLVYYIDKYRFRAVLLGLLTDESLSQTDVCPVSDKNVKQLCIAYWVPISLHIDWILSTIENN